MGDQKRKHGGCQVARHRATKRDKIRAYWANPENRAAQAERVRKFVREQPGRFAEGRAARRAAMARPEVREKMRLAKLGKKQSPEHIAKRAAALSKPRREGTGRRISDGRKRAALARQMGA